MAFYLNMVQLAGNLGRDPDIRTMQNGGRVASLSLATTEFWKDRDGERQERTEWHRVVIFGDGLVRVVEQYLLKGSGVYVRGRLQTRKWQDQSGNDRYTTEIVLSGPQAELRFTGDPKANGNGRRDEDSRSSERSGGYGAPSNDGGWGQGSGYDGDFDDDIPF